MIRVLAWPRSPSRMTSCPASRAFSSWGRTRVLEAEHPGDQRLAGGDAGRGVAPDLLGDRDRLPARGAQLAERAGQTRPGGRSVPGPGVDEWVSVRGAVHGRKPKPRKPGGAPISSRPDRRQRVACGELVRPGPVPVGAAAGRCAGPGATVRRDPGVGERDGGCTRPVRRQRDGRHDGGTQPGRHEGQDAVHLAALTAPGAARPRAARQAARVDRAQVVALAEHHQRRAVQVGHADAAPSGQRVVGSDRQDQLVVEEGRGGHQRVG